MYYDSMAMVQEVASGAANVRTSTRVCGDVDGSWWSKGRVVLWTSISDTSCEPSHISFHILA